MLIVHRDSRYWAGPGQLVKDTLYTNVLAHTKVRPWFGCGGRRFGPRILLTSVQAPGSMVFIAWRFARGNVSWFARRVSASYAASELRQM